MKKSWVCFVQHSLRYLFFTFYEFMESKNIIWDYWLRFSTYGENLISGIKGSFLCLPFLPLVFCALGECACKMATTQGIFPKSFTDCSHHSLFLGVLIISRNILKHLLHLRVVLDSGANVGPGQGTKCINRSSNPSGEKWMLKDRHVKCHGGCFKRKISSLTTVILGWKGGKHQKLILLVSLWTVLIKRIENLPANLELVSMY